MARGLDGVTLGVLAFLIAWLVLCGLLIWRGPRVLKAFKRLMESILLRGRYLSSVEEVEAVCREMCGILGIEWSDFLALLRVMSRSSDWSRVKFRAAGLEVEVQYDSWKGLTLTVSKQEQGVKTTKEYDLSYLKPYQQRNMLSQSR